MSWSHRGSWAVLIVFQMTNMKRLLVRIGLDKIEPKSSNLFRGCDLRCDAFPVIPPDRTRRSPLERQPKEPNRRSEVFATGSRVNLIRSKNADKKRLGSRIGLRSYVQAIPHLRTACRNSAHGLFHGVFSDSPTIATFGLRRTARYPDNQCSRIA